MKESSGQARLCATMQDYVQPCVVKKAHKIYKNLFRKNRIAKINK